MNETQKTNEQKENKASEKLWLVDLCIYGDTKQEILSLLKSKGLQDNCTEVRSGN